MKNLFKKEKYYLKYHQKLKKINQSLTFNINKYPKIWKKIYYKEYPRLPNFLLPLFNTPKADLFECLVKRRTKRKFSKNLNLREISTILFYSAGISYLGKNINTTRRFYPSGGARYPLETYLFLFSKIDRLKKGLYHYNVKKHSLELLYKKDLFTTCKEAMALPNKNIITTKSILIVITSVIGRSYIKYGELSYKLSLLEAGHLGQNLYLISSALHLNCCALGWIDEDIFSSLIDIKKNDEIIIYSLVLGK